MSLENPIFMDEPPEDWKGPAGDRYIFMLMRETPEWALARIRLGEELQEKRDRARAARRTRRALKP